MKTDITNENMNVKKRDGTYNKMKTLRTISLFFLIVLFSFPSVVFASRIFFAGYDGGFYIRSEEEGGMELRLGGAFQVDWQKFSENVRADDGFDVRRARLAFRGELTQWFRFGLEYEFQGNEIKHLVDAYGEGVYTRHALRFGQFKEPFSLQWQSRDKAQFFAERSIGYYLTPKRDLGLMLHGTFLHDGIYYGAGIFNGEGVDGSVGGDERDDPEFAGRILVAPFQGTDNEWFRAFHIGTSATYARIDLADVDLEVKSTGMAGSDRNIFVLKQNTKFGRLQDVQNRIRYGLESIWTKGPFALAAEYAHLKYTDLKPSGHNHLDADFTSWYVSLAWCITGEPIFVSRGSVKPVYPNRFFNPTEKTYGAFCVATRLEHFEGDENWIKKDAFVSVKEANGISFAINWILFPMHRIVLDYTYTDFSDPLRVRVDPDTGSVDYVDEESVFTLRMSMDF